MLWGRVNQSFIDNDLTQIGDFEKNERAVSMHVFFTLFFCFYYKSC